MKTQTRTIMLLDDDKFLLDMYAQKFTHVGYIVHAETSTKAALATLRQGTEFDAILFDLIMPEGDGFFFLQVLQKEKLAPDAKKIALTNEMTEEERTRALELGADDYIVKATKIPSEVVEYVTRILK